MRCVIMCKRSKLSRTFTCYIFIIKECVLHKKNWYAVNVEKFYLYYL